MFPSHDRAAIALDFETISDAATSFDGSLLGISIYDSALTAAQHRTIAQSARTLIESRGYPKVISNLNPSGYWRLGEASGTTAFDESGNDNDGVINGSPVMATADGALHQSKLKAMTFDGVDDYISFLTPTGCLANNTKTISLLLNLPTLAVIQQIASTRINHGGVDNSGKGYGVEISTSGEVNYYHIFGS